MPKIDGPMLAKFMEHLETRVLDDLPSTLFDDGLSEIAVPILAIHRDYMVIKSANGEAKTLSRAKAAQGFVEDPLDRLGQEIVVILGETFPRRAARLLGDLNIESALKQRLDQSFSNEMSQVMMLSDRAAEAFARFVLDRDLPEEDVEYLCASATAVGAVDLACAVEAWSTVKRHSGDPLLALATKLAK
jgi:hypothetical protein